MPRSGYYQQRCPCKNKKDHAAKVAVSIAASSLGVVPRVKSKTITVYLCAGCIRSAKRGTRAALFQAAITSARDVIAGVKEAAK